MKTKLIKAGASLLVVTTLLTGCKTTPLETPQNPVAPEKESIKLDTVTKAQPTKPKKLTSDQLVKNIESELKKQIKKHGRKKGLKELDRLLADGAVLEPDKDKKLWKKETLDKISKDLKIKATEMAKKAK